MAALLLRLRDPRSGRPLPRARLWSELSVRTLDLDAVVTSVRMHSMQFGQ